MSLNHKNRNFLCLISVLYPCHIYYISGGDKISNVHHELSFFFLSVISDVHVCFHGSVIILLQHYCIYTTTHCSLWWYQWNLIIVCSCVCAQSVPELTDADAVHLWQKHMLMPKRVLLYVIHCRKISLHMWFVCEILLIRCLVCELKWLEWCWLAIWQIWVNVTTHPPSPPQATKGKTEKSKEDEDTITRLCAWMYACGNKSMVCWLCPRVYVCVCVAVVLGYMSQVLLCMPPSYMRSIQPCHIL